MLVSMIWWIFSFPLLLLIPDIVLMWSEKILYDIYIWNSLMLTLCLIYGLSWKCPMGTLTRKCILSLLGTVFCVCMQNLTGLLINFLCSYLCLIILSIIGSRLVKSPTMTAVQSISPSILLIFLHITDGPLLGVNIHNIFSCSIKLLLIYNVSPFSLISFF